MSTPLMPELPKAEVHRAVWDGDWHQYHDRSDPLPATWDDEPPDEVCGLYSGDQLRAYGLAVWKAAIEAAADAVTYPVGTPWWLPPPAHKVVRALASLPESDMTQARGE